MCKYCKEVSFDGQFGYKKFARNGGANIAYDPENVGFLLQVPGGFTFAITHCPWCGLKLEIQDDEVELSAEEEIKRLEGRINHTNTLLKRLVEAVRLWVDQSEYNPSATPEVIETLLDIIGKI